MFSKFWEASVVTLIFFVNTGIFTSFFSSTWAWTVLLTPPSAGLPVAMEEPKCPMLVVSFLLKLFYAGFNPSISPSSGNSCWLIMFLDFLNVYGPFEKLISLGFLAPVARDLSTSVSMGASAFDRPELTAEEGFFLSSPAHPERS
jgi:hypothetical protein